MRVYLSDLISNFNNNLIVIQIFYIIYQHEEKNNKRNEIKNFPSAILF